MAHTRASSSETPLLSSTVICSLSAALTTSLTVLEVRHLLSSSMTGQGFETERILQWRDRKLFVRVVSTVYTILNSSPLPGKVK